MKTNKSHITLAAAIACLLAITSCANTTPKKVQQPTANDHWSNLQPSCRANHNPLLDPSFYNSNHQIPS
jgi:hypothetical protein